MSRNRQIFFDETPLAYLIHMNALLKSCYSTCFARCLVFVDDVQQAEVWKDTVDACPKNGSRSRIVVTTSVRSVATACSSGSYVYRMQCLSNDDSKTLFWRKVYGCQKDPPYSLVTDSESIFCKCGGLPRALTSVAKHLNIKGDTLDSSHCTDVGQNC